MFYRNRTSSLGDNVPDAGQTIVTSANVRLRIDPNHLSQIVQQGTTVLLRCVAQSLTIDNRNSKLLPVVWIRENAPLPAQNRQTQGILEIFNAQPDASGVYYCLSNDVDGSILKLRANLVVLDPKQPKELQRVPLERQDPFQFSALDDNLAVTLEPRVLTVRAGETAIFKCIVQGQKPIEINWYKTATNDELAMIISPETISDQGVRLVNKTLVIEAAQFSDFGDYYCQVSNSQGTQKARSRLIVNQDDQLNSVYTENPVPDQRNQHLTDMNIIIPPKVHLVPERQTIIQGKTGYIHCMTSGSPTPKITWIKARSELSPARHFVVQGQNKSTLEIRDAIIEDRGLYVCRSENSGGIIQQSSIVEIERREIPAVEIYPSAVQMLPQDSSALFQCRVIAGIPTPTIEWRNADGTDLEDVPNVELLPGGVIRFTKLSPEQQGKYICAGYNQAGRVTAEALLHVQGSINVRIKQTGPYRVRAGDRVKLDCSLNGQSTEIPEFRIEWRKIVSNQSQIQIPYIAVESNKASLIINQVSTDDAGFFLCLGRLFDMTLVTFK